MTRKIYKRPTTKPHELHGIVTVSEKMLAFFELLRRVARSQASVLIRGDSGTGKELVARAIHRLSRRRDGPFQAINCATLTPELLASELFGHVRGAFTGAIRDRRGLFARADKGTIFLDEIGEMPLGLQARLLRVLQERSFIPVGGTERVSVDVRLLSATNKALREEVEHGRFREDLMYRIRVVPIWLPRLADREGDVEALVWHFIDELNKVEYRQIEGIDAEAREALLHYDWPGNVRELHNNLEYAFVIGEGPILSIGDLPPELRGEPPPVSERRRTADMTERDLERQQLLESLRKSGGRKGEAAEMMGISRSTLWRKLKEHRIT